MAPRRVSADERRARLAARHHVAPPARVNDVVAVARDLVGLHGTDPATVFLSAAARLRTPRVEAVERALYDDRLLVRTLCMRRTIFVVPVELVPVVQAACTDALVPAERRRLLQLLEQNRVADHCARWLKEAEEEAIAAIEAAGEITGAELSKAVPVLATQLAFAEGKKWGGTVGASTRILFLLACEQRIVRGRPKGSWISSQYRWSPMSAWLPEAIPALTPAEARVQLLRRWLASYGPGTLTDIKWWTGWTLGQVKSTVAQLDVAEVDLDGATGLLLADDVEPARPVKPWVALLPSLDSTVMGWKERDWYLGDYASAVFDRNGNAGPTVWCEGRVVGGWAQRKDGNVVFRLLEDIGAAATAKVEAEAARIQAWLGDVRVTPRFPTPLLQELASARI